MSAAREHAGGNADFPHLPAGREPGAQSRRLRGGRTFLAPFVGIVGLAMYAAGVWVAAGGRGGGFDRQEELWGGIFFAAMGLLCLYGGLVIGSRGRPQRHPRLKGTELVVEGAAARRGGEVAVVFRGRRQPGDRLEVGLACDERYDTEATVYVRGATTTTRQTGVETVHEEWQPVPEGLAEHTLTFSVPAGVPYSYEGDCLSYAWRVSARRPAGAAGRAVRRPDLGGAVRLDLRLDADVVAPGGELRGHVLVLEGGPARSTTLRISFTEHAPALAHVAFEAGGVLAEGDLASGASLPFSVSLPPEAPPSARGRHGELAWAVEAAVDAPGLDPKVSRPFEVRRA